MREVDADTRHKLAAKAYLRRHDSCKKGKEMYLAFDHLLWGLYMPDYPISKRTRSRGPRQIIQSCRRPFNLTPISSGQCIQINWQKINGRSRIRMQLGRVAGNTAV